MCMQGKIIIGKVDIIVVFVGVIIIRLNQVIQVKIVRLKADSFLYFHHSRNKD